MTSTCLSIDPEALLSARRDLLRHAAALTAVDVTPPGTRSTSVLTVEAFDRVVATVAELVEDLRALADALARLVDDLAAEDCQVRTRFDRLLTGTIA